METRRLRSGFTAQLSYTYAKSIDNAAVGARNPLVPQNWLDLSAEALGNRLRTMPMKFQIGLDKLTPGEYTCQVTVLDAQRRKAAQVMLIPLGAGWATYTPDTARNSIAPRSTVDTPFHQMSPYK